MEGEIQPHVPTDAEMIRELYALNNLSFQAINDLEHGNIRREPWKWRIGDPGPTFRLGPFTIKREHDD